jgi:hypothetical protein
LRRVQRGIAQAVEPAVRLAGRTKLCAALQIDSARQDMSDVGRPFKIAEGKPIADALA